MIATNQSHPDRNQSDRAGAVRTSAARVHLQIQAIREQLNRIEKENVGMHAYARGLVSLRLADALKHTHEADRVAERFAVPPGEGGQ